MKVAYIVTVEIWKYDGLSKKIIDQIRSWNDLGVQTKAFFLIPPYIEGNQLPQFDFQYEYIFASPSGVKFIDSEYKFAKFLNFPKLLDSVSEYSPTNIYMRYELLKPFMIAIYKLKKQADVTVEINMLDLKERESLTSRSLLSHLVERYNRMTRSYVFRMAEKFVTVTHEIASDTSISKFNKPTHVAYNSIDIHQTTIRKKGNVGRKIRLLFMVSKEYPWHGVDKLYNFAEYYKDEIELLMIGNFLAKSTLHNVNYAGFLSNLALEAAVESCDIAVSSLAIHRCGLKEACPLKTRDYLAWGFPTILGYQESIFLSHDLKPWILQIENTEQSINNNHIQMINFCRANRGIVVPKEDVANLVHSEIIEKRRLDFILRTSYQEQI
ncbi:hypothetical protein [Pseudobacteriovorax antillogorgiicola]|uniref:Uncharacterized protein n=1 Tax=Pseudobacteriovorax antillogorgiicola TaxID=1513793 RepID=A0A1Y6CMS7_9BACT|nr:hypothetical protein [Pseudobacteriovorax antillogorgiicola]TCS45236.1 hypothetical protein EDD56_12970 [Pseudobacteriovorax antillogorgiicola]SMF75319.1 hypothetical protein SAMN06296036_12910 [Pseudobacteriovorax antillogorgiicola]